MSNNKIIGFTVASFEIDHSDIDLFKSGLNRLHIINRNQHIYFWGIGDIEKCIINGYYSLSFPHSISLLDRNVLFKVSEDKIEIENDWLGSIPIFYNEENGAVSTLINKVLPNDEISIDNEGLKYYFQFGYCAFKKTPVKNVKFMRYFSKIQLTEKKLSVIEKDDPVHNLMKEPCKEEETFSLIRKYINNVEEKIKGDIILPTSGGYDSRLLNLLIQDKQRIRSFTYGLSENQSESFEVVIAKGLSQAIGTRWRQIELGEYNKYIPEWFFLYGISTHIHGMYHIEFYHKIRSFLVQDARSRFTFLSGIFGDVWAGNVGYQQANTYMDIKKLGYTHGIDLCDISEQIDLDEIEAKKFYREYRDKLDDYRWQPVITIRAKIILISYLMNLPDYFGFPSWTPYLNFDIVNSMLNIPKDRWKGRKWQKDFFIQNNIDLDKYKEKSNSRNLLDLFSIHCNLPPLLDEKLLAPYVKEDVVSLINANFLNYNHKRSFKNNAESQMVLKNHSQYRVLKALELLLKQRVSPVAYTQSKLPNRQNEEIMFSNSTHKEELNNGYNKTIVAEKYYSENKKYFAFQKEIGEFGGQANLFKFSDYISPHYSVIDFGCGGGYLLKNIQCHSKVGIEVNAYARQQAESLGIKVVKALEEIPDHYADLIISNHALEHVENPLATLKALKNKIKNNGEIIFVVPHQDIREGFNPDDVNNHLYTWNMQTLGNIFKYAGFEIISIDLIQHQWPPNYIQLYREKGEIFFHKICHEYAKKNNNYQIRIVAKNFQAKSFITSSSTSKGKNAESPVILVAYNRPWHTQRVLDALRSHDIRNIYIFSDGPKSDTDSPKVTETRALFEKIDWCKPEIVESEENIGLAESITRAVDYVFTKHGRLILLEDDCVPQKHFFDFIGTCLNKYENNEEIFGISGYTVPIPESILSKYPYDLYFSPRIGSWGWATWKRAWQHFEPDLAKAYKKMLENNIDLSQGGTDIPLMINEMLNGRLKDVWTLHWVLSVYLNKGCYIYPTISHIENIGMDGSGVHCGATRKFITPMAARNPSRYPDDVKIDEDIYRNFRKYYDIQKPNASKRKVSSETKPFLKVVQLCMQDFGGAGKAAYRLHKGLQSIGVDSTMLVLNKRTSDPSVKVLPNDYSKGMTSCLDTSTYNSPMWNQQAMRWQKLMLKYPRRPAGLEVFTDAISDVKLDRVREIHEADLINLHWVAGVMDWPSAPLAISGKPVVWTLHDMNPFTGGCHYAGDCKKYVGGCGECPQIGSEDDADLSRHIWEQKYEAYTTLNINIVTPSRWLGKCASASKLLSRFQVNVIPNGFPIDIFKPYTKEEVRKTLNIPESAKVILFGADSVVNQRKGFRYLLDALNKFPLRDEYDIVMLTFGNLQRGVKITSKYPVINLGPIGDENTLAKVYSAAEAFVIPSLEDNLPNTVVESMACGVPVIGFDIGGIPDMIEHKKTGYLVKPKDAAGLIEGIEWVISSNRKASSLSKQCREKVEKEFSLQVQAKAYKELYEQVASEMLRAKNDNAEAQAHSIRLERKAGADLPESLHQSAIAFVNAGRKKEGMISLEALLKSYPDFALAHNDLGVLYYKAGKKEDAFEHYKKAAELQPENITFQKNLADFYYFEQGEMEEAMKIYVNILGKNQKDVETLLILGNICVALKKFEDAKIFYSRAVEVDPGNKDAMQNLKKVQAFSEDRDHIKTFPIDIDREKNSKNITKSDEYLVSAIVSTYNSERFIRGCLEDLENQTISDKLEIIVIDSNSQQGEHGIVNEMQKKYGNIVYIRTAQRETVYASWNRGIKAASGKYITNANTDDRHAPYAFEKLIQTLEDYPYISLVYANVWITEKENETFDNFTPAGRFCWKEFDPVTLLDGCYIGPQPMWRKAVHDRYGFFNERFHSAGDWEFWLRMAKDEKFLHLNEFLGLYLKSPNSIEHRDLKLSREEAGQIHKQYSFLRLGKERQDTDAAKKMYQNAQMLVEKGMDNAAIMALGKLLESYPEFALAHNDLGVLYYKAGKKEDAFEHYKKAAELQPENINFQKNLADFYYVERGKVQEAIEIYVKILALNPQDIECLLMLGHISVSIEKIDDAKVFYMKVLEVDPQNIDAKQNLDSIQKYEKGAATVKPL
jgi:glycosyltransferase involved in cell wall biosynthesis/Flp pilus assembly protein TadD/GT2 family glycosyltransferase/2-polyprenyl-3-methyl-5-hydroxy-6-metoxy-1,4-benzoquinol methylase